MKTMQTRARTIQALACATIAGTIWSLWRIVPFVFYLVHGYISAEYFSLWFFLGLDFAASVMAGTVAVQTLMKRRKARTLCWMTVALLVLSLSFHRDALFNIPMFSLLVYVTPLVLVAFRLFDQSTAGVGSDPGAGVRAVESASSAGSDPEADVRAVESASSAGSDPGAGVRAVESASSAGSDPEADVRAVESASCAGDDPGADVRTDGLILFALLFFGGIVAIISGAADRSSWENVVTKAGRQKMALGSALATVAGSFLLPLLSFAAWKTSKHRCQQAKRILNGDTEVAPVRFSAEQLAGSVEGWGSCWMVLSVLSIVGFVLCTLIEIFGEAESWVVLLGARLDPTVLFGSMIQVGLFMYLWGKCLSEQGEEAKELARKLKAHARGDAGEWKRRQIQSVVDGMVSIPGQHFLVGKFQVTQAQWEAVMETTPSEHEGDDLPVENVSWDDCQAFLKKLNALPSVKDSGLKFRLPTEEEWEYACRAGATGDYCRLVDGTEITETTLGQVAWFDENSGNKTQPVGQKQPNAFDLYDMHGNVWEWTSTADGESFVARGGSWGSVAGSCESSYRRSDPTSYHFLNLGFRLCADRAK